MPRVEIRFDGVSRGLQSHAAKSREAIKSVGVQADHSTKQASKGFRQAERDVGRFSRGALAGSGAVRGLARSVAFASASFLGGVGLMAVLRQSISRASDLHEQMNKVDVVFGENARSIRAWSKTSATSFGLARSEALQFVGTFGNLLTPMGIAPNLAARMSKRLVQLAGDMASFNNVSPEETLQALNSGLTGMVRPLRRFGVFLDQNRIALEAVRSGIVKSNVDMGKAADAETKIAIARAKLADAQKKYGAGTTQVAAAQVTLHAAERALQTELAGRVPTLTAAQKAQASYNLILRDTANAQGDFKRTSGGLANQQRILRAELINLQEELGTALMPTVLRLTKGITGYIQTLEAGGRRHAAFVRTLGQIRDVMRLVWATTTTVARALNLAANAMGGWGNAFQLVTSLFLAHKFIQLAGAIGKSRLALILLNRVPPATAGGGPFSAFMGAGGGTAGAGVGRASARVTALKGALRSLAGLGVITIAIELLIHRKLVGDVLGNIAGGDQPGGAPGVANIGGGVDNAVKWARYYKSHGMSKVEARAAMLHTELWSGSGGHRIIEMALDQVYGHGRAGSAGGGEAVVRGKRGKGARDRAAFVAIEASRDPNAGSTSFHLPGERQPYDCSAFVQAVYRKAGISIGSTTYAQVKQGQRVSRGDLRPGDLIFMNFPGERSPGHVGIYVGGGMMVHDHGAHGGVSYQAVPWGNVVDLRTYSSSAGGSQTITPGGDTTAATGGGGLRVGKTSRRKATDTPDHAELVSARRTARFLERRLPDVVSPTLRRNLRKRIDALLEELQHVGTEGELRKLRARLDKVAKAFARAMELGQATRTLRASARALSERISRLPESIAKDLRARMEKVRAALADVTSAGQLKRLRAELEKIREAVNAALDKMRADVERKRDLFSRAFERVADKMLQAFDAKTQDLLDHARAQVAGFGFEIGVGEETPSERRLRERDAARSAEELAQRVADAQQALAEAQGGGDSRAILEAQRELQQALYDQETAGLEERARAEREAADKALADRQKEIQADRDLLREQFADRIQAIEDAFANEEITAEQARDALVKLLSDPAYGLSFGEIGSLLGQAFNVGLQDALTKLTDALVALAAAVFDVKNATGEAVAFVGGIGDWLRGHGGGGVFTGGGGHGGGAQFAHGGRVPGQWLGREDTILAHVSPDEEVIDRSTSRALRAFLIGGGRAGVGASYGPIYVLGTTKREVAAALAEITGPELDRKIGYGAGSASGYRGRRSTSGRP